MKVALAEIDILWEEKEGNKLRCSRFVKMAAKKGASLIIFPEMCLTGFSMNTQLIAEKVEKDSIDHYDISSASIDFFKEEAKKNNICIAFGMVEAAKEKAFNKLYIVDPKGNIIFDYSKIHPFSFGEEPQYYTSGSKIEYCELERIKISGFICYDLRFPEIFQIASKESELIILVANWPEVRREHWITLLKARAIENQCYIAGVNRIGEGNGDNYNGDSLLIDPYGNCADKDTYEIVIGKDVVGKVIIAEIKETVVKQYREEFQLKSDRREELYRIL